MSPGLLLNFLSFFFHSTFEAVQLMWDNFAKCLTRNCFPVFHIFISNRLELLTPSFFSPLPLSSPFFSDNIDTRLIPILQGDVKGGKKEAEEAPPFRIIEFSSKLYGGGERKKGRPQSPKREKKLFLSPFLPVSFAGSRRILMLSWR